MNDLVVPDNEYTPVSLELPSDLDFDGWQHRGKMLMLLQKATAWWIGDWLNFGEHTFGEMYTQAVDVTGKDLDTLRKYQWVAEQIPPERRRERLTFGHHDAIASLPPVEQDKLLDEAIESDWNVTDIRKAANKQKDTPGQPEKPVDCPSCGFNLTDWLENR